MKKKVFIQKEFATIEEMKKAIFEAYTHQEATVLVDEKVKIPLMGVHSSCWKNWNAVTSLKAAEGEKTARFTQPEDPEEIFFFTLE